MQEELQVSSASTSEGADPVTGSPGTLAGTDPAEGAMQTIECSPHIIL